MREIRLLVARGLHAQAGLACHFHRGDFGVEPWLDVCGQRLRYVSQGFFIDRQTQGFAAGRDAKPQIALPVFVEHGHERNQALLEFGQAGFEFDGFGFDLGPCDGRGPSAVLGREVMRNVFGLVGREQGRSAWGRGNVSAKTLIVMVLIIEIVRKCGSL